MEQNLQALLKSKLAKARRVAVLCIGSEFRGDDAAGVMAGRHLAGKLPASKKPEIKIFEGATAPENLTGEIKRFKPSHLVIIDSVEVGQEPGTIFLLDPDAIDGATFSTHTMPARILSDYMRRATKCKTVIIGIQAATVEFGAKMSRKVRGSVRIVCDSFIKAAGRVEHGRKNK